VVSNFIRQAVRGEPLTLYGDGMQTRSFCYVDDLVEGLMRAMATEDDFTGPVNLGNPEEFTIRELAERVVKAVGGSARIEQARPLPQDDPAQRCPDIRLAQRVLGWQPRVTLAEGLPRTVEWFKQIDMTKFRAPTPNY
jgi:UDP-glucuronate decarboxylase